MDNARRHGVRVVGPNCLGIMRPDIGLNATFARGNALPGTLALVSQSGAVCTAMVDWARPNKVGFSSLISMGTLRELTPKMLARFTQIDYDREMALIATVEREREGGEVELGVCRYITNPDGASCEFAIVIADEQQGRGLGRRMMTQLIAVARARGLQTMIGHVMGRNRGMLSLCQSLGFMIAENAEDPMVKRVTLVRNG